jgi:two-component system response regulator HydG
MTSKERILVVEDDEDLRTSCRQVLVGAGYDVLVAGDPVEAEPLILREMLDLVITDLRMPHGGGEKVVHIVKGATPDVPVLVVTAYPTVESAVRGFRDGIADYILKPFTGDQLLDAIRRALGAKRADDSSALARRMGANAPDMPFMLGGSPAFRALLADIRRIAPLDGNALVLGETGSGKELVARAIHAFSKRKTHPLIVVNCAAIPENLLESELFGYERGAFTGATTPKAGLLEEAHEGSLFLDEVAELTAAAQAKLLRCLEEKAVRRVGATRSRPADARIIAATHKNLAQAVADGKFREDLFYRLSVLDIRVPPLRDRPEDVLPLAVAFLDRLCKESDRRVVGFTEEAVDRLVEHSWPGNVRELQNAVQKAFSRAEGSVIIADDLVLGRSSTPAQHPVATGTPQRRTKALAEFEREHVKEALERNEGNVTHAAKALGVHRTTLQRLMKRLGLTGAAES